MINWPLLIESTSHPSLLPKNQGVELRVPTLCSWLVRGNQPLSLGAPQKPPSLTKTQLCWRRLVMNNKTSFHLYGSVFRNWGRDTKYYNKRCCIAYCSGNSKSVERCKPGTMDENQYIWEIYFGHMNDQIYLCISYKSQYHISKIYGLHLWTFFLKNYIQEYMSKYKLSSQRLYPEALLVSHCEVNSTALSFSMKCITLLQSHNSLKYTVLKLPPNSAYSLCPEPISVVLSYRFPILTLM